MTKWKMILLGALLIGQTAMATLNADEQREVEQAVATGTYDQVSSATVESLILENAELYQAGYKQEQEHGPNEHGYGAHSCAEYAKANKCKNFKWDNRVKSCACY